MICSKSDPDSIKKCTELLKNGEVLVLPTDTVYGFSGIVGKTDSKIRKIKGRAETKPFIQLISSASDISSITDDQIPEKLLSIWPGPLTIIVHSKEDPSVTVAVRCPGDPWLRQVIAAVGAPLYSTSVNRSGSPVLQKVSEIKDEFENEVALIVDGGDSENSVPSTIVKIDSGVVTVVRKGAVAID